MTAEDNPLLADEFRIPYHRIRSEHIGPGVTEALSEAQGTIDEIASDPTEPTWRNTIERLDEAVERLARRVAPAGHLVSVEETPALREAYNEVLPAMSAFYSRLPLNAALWDRMRAFAATEEASGQTGLRRRHLDKTIEEFVRAGADLPDASKDRLQALNIELAQLAQKFSENVLDATAAYELTVTDADQLRGIPEAALRRAAARAAEKGLGGWLLTLDYPSVEPILKYCEDRELRQKIQIAFATRCREGQFDNRPLLARILRLRDEVADVLGYRGFADYALADRMARTGERARAFERDMEERTRPYWRRDVHELGAYARSLGIDPVEPWDAAFVMERLRKERYDIDDEQLRPFFPLPRVLDGMFEIVRRTFGFRVEEKEIEETWHPDVRFFEIFDEDDVLMGAFYCDWFPRKQKRQGAWMNHFITGGPTADGFAPHLGVMCGNFTPPDGDEPALLTHREVQTTFHEFGHLLHHCTSRVEVPSRAGIHVAWDWVELPSQLMENWTWEREAIDVFAGHHETGARLPDDVFDKMIAARRFMSGWGQMRQISLGTVDLALHDELGPELRSGAGPDVDAEVDAWQGERVMAYARERFSEFAPGPGFAELHVLTSFTHLFAGGYAAGYYSYLWSEVLDADVFTRFQREGIFNRETGRHYVDSILSRGDSDEPESLFRRFMGRSPDPEALLIRNLGPIPA